MKHCGRTKRPAARVGAGPGARVGARRGAGFATRLRVRTAALAMAGALALGAVAACATNPVTGKPQLALISESQEIEMGRQGAQQVEQSVGLVPDSSLQRYVNGVGVRIARTTERPNLPWEFHVVDDPTPNAFALPGGFVFVTRGLMDLMDSESELSTILGHEIGHVTARHSVSQLSKAELAQIGVGLGSVIFPQAQQLGGLASTGLQLLFLKYSRDDERQADDLGFRYSQQAGYDPREMADVFVALQRIGEQEGQSPLPSWLSTHPATQERIQVVQQRIAQLGSVPDSARVGRADYLAHIEGLIYGQNPRNGYFDGTTFLHPDLRFTFVFPQGWATQNLPQAVVGTSPQQDAAVQVTLSGEASSSAAANAFVSQQGVSASAPSRQRINGLPATATEFNATTSQGAAIHGLAVFVDYDGRTYQILGYATTGAFSGYATTLSRTLGSFRPLTDPAALAVKPNRIEIVRADRTETLAAFNTRYPSVVPIEELAIINQVDNGSSTIPAGTRVKRVVRGS